MVTARAACTTTRTRRQAGPLRLLWLAAVLIAAGNNPERLRSKSSLTAFCGVSPVEAPPGRPSADA